jgi:hypothetical protein
MYLLDLLTLTLKNKTGAMSADLRTQDNRLLTIVFSNLKITSVMKLGRRGRAIEISGQKVDKVKEGRDHQREMDREEPLPIKI